MNYHNIYKSCHILNYVIYNMKNLLNEWENVLRNILMNCTISVQVHISSTFYTPQVKIFNAGNLLIIVMKSILENWM